MPRRYRPREVIRVLESLGWRTVRHEVAMLDLKWRTAGTRLLSRFRAGSLTLKRWVLYCGNPA